MTQSLLLIAWPYNGQVLTSFRWATGYQMPSVYTGDASLTQISSKVNATGFEVVYLCKNCLKWDHDGEFGHVSTTKGNLVLGRAQAKNGPTGAGCPDTIKFGYHDAGFGQWGADLTGVPNANYAKWAGLATKRVTGACAAAPPASTPAAPVTTPVAPVTSVAPPATTPVTTVVASPSPAAPSPSPAAPPATPAASCPAINQTYDYIVIGGGAGGLPIADRLSQAGHTVLLVEKGPPSTARWGGTLKPDWLIGQNLTRFDVPGLCNEIWHDSTGIACTDTDQVAGCVLGGGTAVNAGLWWKPHPEDWNWNFPAGWHDADVAAATQRVFSRIPGTTVPSQDGKLYRQEGFNVLASGLLKNGWTYLDSPNAKNNLKNHTFGHTTFMFSGGERGGPLATYLVSATQRKGFTLWTNTSATRLTRNGGHITGVELESAGPGGKCGSVRVTPNKGRVIVSAGTFGSAKLLLRSGIGPADQLQVVQSSNEGVSMASQDNWISLPVGYNLNDHLDTDLVVTHPDVVFYDFYQAWDDPNINDALQYLSNRSGILAMAAPNIGPMMWDEIVGKDGITRQLQWTSRVEGSMGVDSLYAMTISQYLGRGATSRGRMAITKSLNTVVSQSPYLHDPNDLDAVIQGVKNMQNALKGVANLSWASPTSNLTAESYVNSLVVSPSARRANHWMGTNKLGKDDGRTGGTAVVDLDTKVYGTDNLFVVDASIFPGMSTGNPSAMIVIASEHASERILALPFPKAGALGETCGGKAWSGSSLCASGLVCKYWTADVSTVSSPSVPAHRRTSC